MKDLKFVQQDLDHLYPNATLCRKLTTNVTAPSPRTTSFLESAPNTISPTCDFETPLKGFVL